MSVVDRTAEKTAQTASVGAAVVTVARAHGHSPPVEYRAAVCLSKIRVAPPPNLGGRDCPNDTFNDPDS
jgi:hypothetical protein